MGRNFEFDAVALFEALDRQRRGRGLSWTQVSVEVGVAPSTLTRARHGQRMEADGMRAMVRWLGRSPEDFIVGPRTLVGLVPRGAPGGGRRRRIDTTALHAGLDARRTAAGLTWADLGAELGVAPRMLTRLARRGRIDVGVLARVAGFLGAPIEGFTYDCDD